MKLNDVVRKEISIEKWKDEPELVERVLVRLNNLHRVAVQKVLEYESQIRAAGDEPLVKVVVVFPDPPPEPEKPEGTFP